MDTITLDFETYYDTKYSLKQKLYTTSSYIRSHKFEVMCLGLKRNDQPIEAYYPNDVEKVLRDIDWSNTALLAHNTAFDGFILHHRYGIHPRYYLDTLSMARALHGHRIGVGLESVAQHLGYGGKHAGVLDNLRGKRFADLDPEQAKRMALYCARDVELCKQLFDKMVSAFPQSELDLIDLTVRMFCEPRLYIDIPAVKSELVKEIAGKKALISATGLSAKELGSNKTFVQALANYGITAPTKVSKRTGKEAYAFAKTDEDFTELLEHDDGRVQDLVRARLAVKSSIGETRPARFIREGKNSWPLPVGLNYYGAITTGRWSGGNKQNLQNLPRGGALRRSIKAPKGSVVVVADSGQIECRVNAWLAGQDDLIQLFANNGDPYCAMASNIYGRPITKSDKLERFVGKTAVLGLGYQMGAPKFQTSLKNGIIKVDMALSECKRIVEIYRTTNDKISGQWKSMEEILTALLLGKSGVYGCLSYGNGAITLPNGMKLKYDDLKCEWANEFKAGGLNYAGKRDNRTHIYGGKLTENVVQALSRIIISSQMLEIAQILDVVTMTHDEIVALAPEDCAEEAYNIMHDIMCTPPDWCADLPLAAEGGWDVVYSK